MPPVVNSCYASPGSTGRRGIILSAIGGMLLLLLVLLFHKVSGTEEEEQEASDLFFQAEPSEGTLVVRSLDGRRRPVSATPSQQLRPPLRELFIQLDNVWPCRPNRTVESPLAQQLLNESVRRWVLAEEGTGGNGTMLLALAQLFSKHTYLATSGRALPPNSSIITGLSPFRSMPSSSSTHQQPIPVLAFQLQCRDANPRWSPLAVYPTTIANTFLQVRLPPLALNACPHSRCATHCSYSVHGGVRVFARACCSSDPASENDGQLADPIDDHSSSEQDGWCRDEWLLPQRVFFVLSALCVCFCAVMIGVVIRERRRQQHDRGWALMEPFFAGAITLYAIPLLAWPLHVLWSCWIAMFARQLGFTLFYGSVLLKIYRNLQDYRVRKAQHVIVRELDLIMYLVCAFLLTVYGIIAWSAGSWTRKSLWTSEWPQCPVEEFTVIFALIELLVLLYGIRLCYKARNSSWIERYQFTMAVVLEALVSLVANCIRYSLDEIGSRDTLFLVAVIQLHLTISVNIAAIITPKFLVSSDANRRALGAGMSGMGNSGRAHPSLAKMRENLINGTIDFQEVPIVDMNPEDIRAELKRVYTQLRMYKLKNAYQDNPHISKRKGGGAKKLGGGVELTGSARQQQQAPISQQSSGRGSKAAAGGDSSSVRRISNPASTTNSSTTTALTHQQQQIVGTGGSPKMLRRGSPVIVADEERDLTVESAPHNIHLLTSKLMSGQPPPPPVTAMGADHSIRV